MLLLELKARPSFLKSWKKYKIALKLIKLGLVDFVGSDAHRMRDLKKLESFLKSRTCKKVIKLNRIRNNQ